MRQLRRDYAGRRRVRSSRPNRSDRSPDVGQLSGTLNAVVSSFQALAVFVLALLPGACYTFAFEREAGSFGITASDRLVRFIAASAAFQALLAGPSYLAYRHFVVSGHLRSGQVSAWWVELIAVGYVLVPTAAGYAIGRGQRSDKRMWSWTRFFSGEAPEPRAWDHVWRRRPQAIVRVKLKSGTWIAGTYWKAHGRRPYAAAYPEPSDIYLSAALKVDPDTGAFVRDNNGRPVYVDGNGGLLVRWDEAEYFEITEF